jgi:hypothetical protein
MAIYNQRSYGDTLGSGPGTIAMWGCYLTSYAQVLTDFGFVIDPPTLNGQIPYVDGNELSDYAVDGLFGGAVKTTGVWDFRNTPAHLDMLNDADPSTRYILEVDFDHDPNDGIQTHFVTEASWNGTDLIINDPWYGTTDNFAVHYGTDIPTTIIKVIQLSGPVATPVPEPTPAPESAPEPAPTEPTPEIPVTPIPEPTVPAEPVIVPVESQVTKEPTVETPAPAPVQTPNTIKPDIKPGYQTTEFYITIAAVLLPLVNHFLGTTFTYDQTANIITSLVGGVTAAVSAYLYIVGRIELKLNK